MNKTQKVFVTGGTGYIGSGLIPLLHAQGCVVFALTRETSRDKLPPGCTAVIGDALRGDTYVPFVSGCDTFVQLVGVAHPGPAKAKQFRQIDLVAGLEAIRVAREAGVRHFVYLSVAQPAPVMQPYIAVRAECEAALKASGMDATVVRPWYVLGPGHRWPYLLIPFYKAAEVFPRTRKSALRFGLVTIGEMIRALARIVAGPPNGLRYVQVPEIRRLARGQPISAPRDETVPADQAQK